MSGRAKAKVWNNDRSNFDRTLAVVIGIEHHSHGNIQDLNTAVSDANAIANLLEQHYGYTLIRLTDEEANLETLQHLFHTRIPEELHPGENDRLIIYFAGHGLPRSSDDGPEGYLVPHDADPTEPASFLAMRDISKALDKLECHHLLVILDCCFAGTFRWAGSRKAIPVLETIRQEHYYHFIRHPAWQVITSSAHDQEALDIAQLKEDNRQSVDDGSDSPFADERHSPFALALLEGLHPGDGSQPVKADLFPDGVVTVHELFVYLQTRVKQLSGEQQAPGIYPLRRDYDKGEFVFTPPEFKPEDLAKALPLNEEENNPYRGLKSFDEKHAEFFFGRQALVDELVEHLSTSNRALTVVLGVSGSGKSSLVKAGLLPRLRPPKREQQTEHQAQQWCVLDPMRPGESPFISLSRVLLPIVKPELLEQVTQDSSKQLQNDVQYFSRAIADWSQTHSGVRLLLVIDQLEELLSHTHNQHRHEKPSHGEHQERDFPEEEWQRFLEVLRIAIEDHPQTIHLVLTLRSDFEPRFSGSALQPYWKNARFPIRAMTSDELRQAIEKPALKQAIYFEESTDNSGNPTGNLVNKLVDEVGQMPGALPLLSFTLSELYVSLHERWKNNPDCTDRTLQFKDYEDLGGVGGALTQRADHEYEALNDDSQRASMRTLMLRMVQLEAEGATQRRVRKSELVYSDSQENERIELVINQLVKARLLVEGQEVGETYVEPSHDFLIKGWGMLQSWIRDSEEELILRQRLTPAAKDWHDNNRELQYLWSRDPRLATLEEVLKSGRNNWLNQLEMEFIQASLHQRQDELEEAERQLKISEDRRRSSLARQLAAQSELIQTQQPHLIERSILLAVEAVKRLHSVETDRLLRQGLSLLPLPIQKICESEQTRARTVASSPDGKYLAVGFDSTVQLWQWNENHLNYVNSFEHTKSVIPRRTTFHEEFYVSDIIFVSRDHLTVICYESFTDKEGFGRQESSIWSWSLINAALISSERVPRIINFAFDTERLVLITVFSPSNANVTNEILVWQFADGFWNVRNNIICEKRIQHISCCSGSHLLAFTDEDQVICLQNEETCQVIRQRNIKELCFSPTGQYLITKIEDKTRRISSLHVWNVSDGQEINRIVVQSTHLLSLSCSLDGQYVAAGSVEGITYVWTLEAGKEVARIEHLRDISTYPYTVSFISSVDPQTQLLATATKSAEIWQLDRSPEVIRLCHQNQDSTQLNNKNRISFDAKFSPDGKHFATAIDGGSVFVWDTATESKLCTLQHFRSVKKICFSTDGKYIVASTEYESLIWDWTENTEEPLKRIEHNSCATFSPDNKYMATVSGNKIVIWDVANDIAATDIVHQGQVTSLAFGKGSELIAAGSMNGVTVVWEVASGREVQRALPYENND